MHLSIVDTLLSCMYILLTSYNVLSSIICSFSQCTLTLSQCEYRTDTVSVRPTLKPHISGALPLSETLKSFIFIIFSVYLCVCLKIFQSSYNVCNHKLSNLSESQDIWRINMKSGFLSIFTHFFVWQCGCSQKHSRNKDTVRVQVSTQKFWVSVYTREYRTHVHYGTSISL